MKMYPVYKNAQSIAALGSRNGCILKMVSAKEGYFILADNGSFAHVKYPFCVGFSQNLTC